MTYELSYEEMKRQLNMYRLIKNYEDLPKYCYILNNLNHVIVIEKGRSEELAPFSLLSKHLSPLEYRDEVNKNLGITDDVRYIFEEGSSLYWKKEGGLNENGEKILPILIKSLEGTLERNKEMAKKDTKVKEQEQDIKSESVWLKIHKNFVRENIPYKDKETGEDKTFNSVTLPKGTMIEGKDVGSYQFTPLYIYQDKFNENLVDIPLKSPGEVWLKKADKDGNKDVEKVTPEKIIEALKEGRKRFIENQKESLKDKVDKAEGKAAEVNKGKEKEEKTKDKAR